jgi:outer membrane immunogenic protein
MLRKLLLASAGALALAGSAVAADLPSRAPPPVYVPPVPIFTWTGVYVGGQIGYGWGQQHTNFGDNFGDYTAFSYNASGVIGGAHVGYNLQLNQFVIGLEGDVDGTSMKKSYTGFVPFGTNLGFAPYAGVGNFNVNHSVEGSIRGRLGYAWDRVLVYATGGVAIGAFNGSACANFAATTVFDGFGGCTSSSSTRVGWTVGGGLEYAVTNNWSVRAEYRYSDFGRATQFANSWTNPVLGDLGGFVNRHFQENRVQVGFSYKFDVAPPPVPVVAKY